MWTYVIIGVCVALVLLLCLALAIASFSFENFAQKLKEVDSIRNSGGFSTLNYVNEINKVYFQGKLKIAQCPEWFDHYSPGVVALSAKTMSSNSLASLAIISHELGHARQDTSGDTLKKNWRMKRQGRICGLFFMPLLIVGAVMSILWVLNVLPEIWALAIGLGCAGASLLIFFFAIVLKYKEIQIEKEASVFAVEYLQEVLSPVEVKKCKELLNSARLTYWGTLIRTMLSWTMLTKKDKMFS